MGCHSTRDDGRGPRRDLRLSSNGQACQQSGPTVFRPRLVLDSQILRFSHSCHTHSCLDASAHLRRTSSSCICSVAAEVGSAAAETQAGGVCLPPSSNVISAVLLGLYVFFSRFRFSTTAAPVGLAVLFAWRVFRLPVSYGWCERGESFDSAESSSRSELACPFAA